MWSEYKDSPDGIKLALHGVMQIDPPIVPSPVDLSRDMQASLRFAYWSIVYSHGLGTCSPISQGRLAGRLHLDVTSRPQRYLACRNQDESIDVVSTVSNALIEYHSDPSRYSAANCFVFGNPANAHLTLMHETVHCCGRAESTEVSWRLAAPAFASNIDELVTELCARQILSQDMGIEASEIFGRPDNPGSYDSLILPPAWAVGWACDCEDAEAINRLARAALQLRREHPVTSEMFALSKLIELATQGA